jgi:hypothetical protein
VDLEVIVGGLVNSVGRRWMIDGRRADVGPGLLGQTDRQTDRLQAKHHRVSIGFYIYNPKPEKGRKLRKGE